MSGKSFFSLFNLGAWITGNTGNTGRKRAKKGFIARLVFVYPGANSVPIRTYPYRAHIERKRATQGRFSRRCEAVAADSAVKFGEYP